MVINVSISLSHCHTLLGVDAVIHVAAPLAGKGGSAEEALQVRQFSTSTLRSLILIIWIGRDRRLFECTQTSADGWDQEFFLC